MPKLIFFHDVMADGRVATTLDRGDARLYYRLQRGQGEKNDLVRWGVTLWCEGERVPGDPGEVQHWLLRHEALIRAGMLACAADLEGRPDDPDPPMCMRFSWDEFPERLPGVRMTLTGSKNRELCPSTFSAHLRDVAANWRPLIEALEADDPLPPIDELDG